METIRGKTSQIIDDYGFHARLNPYSHVVLDLGTGDGRYVRTLAAQHPDWFVIGVDACRENLREGSRRYSPNMLFVIANARNLPQEFDGRISHLAIHFPWGSLLESLLKGDEVLMNELSRITRSNAQTDIYLNGGALTETGAALEAGANTIYENMTQYGWKFQTPQFLNPQVLRAFPTTWAKRLAYGRDPRAVALHGTRAKT